VIAAVEMRVRAMSAIAEQARMLVALFPEDHTTIMQGIP
jgi:hypothetical protein